MKAIRPANLRPKSESDGADAGAKAASLRRAARQYRSMLENERSQLIELVDRFEADQEKRRDQKKNAKMHGGLAINRFVPRSDSAGIVNQTRCATKKI
jgi:hypothetical protein